MKARGFVFALVVVVSACGVVIAGSQYQGQEAREIKALSDREVQGYLAGGGMGFAKPAELNHYPGPKHILELAESLALTNAQTEAVQLSFGRMHERAVVLGAQLVELERQLDQLFAQASADDAALHALVLETARVRGELRYTHLRAHAEMKPLLTEDQIMIYDRLRGYGAD